MSANCTDCVYTSEHNESQTTSRWGQADPITRHLDLFILFQRTCLNNTTIHFLKSGFSFTEQIALSTRLKTLHSNCTNSPKLLLVFPLFQLHTHTHTILALHTIATYPMPDCPFAPLPLDASCAHLNPPCLRQSPGWSCCNHLGTVFTVWPRFRGCVQSRFTGRLLSLTLVPIQDCFWYAICCPLYVWSMNLIGECCFNSYTLLL